MHEAVDAVVVSVVIDGNPVRIALLEDRQEWVPPRRLVGDNLVEDTLDRGRVVIHHDRHARPVGEDHQRRLAHQLGETEHVGQQHIAALTLKSQPAIDSEIAQQSPRLGVLSGDEGAAK